MLRAPSPEIVSESNFCAGFASWALEGTDIARNAINDTNLKYRRVELGIFFESSL
jgi:hypothetical protein